ncbi:proton-coupled amino acid transporter 1 [Dermatophagoides farinae]|uniref:proton-coupled amino acid transporter 1 n=1 Tax=Dermatophagoides farinae TaxID=6954 RepID=UPI003F60E520
MPSDSSCSPYTAEIIDSRITISGRSARDQEIESMENKSSTIMMKKKTEQLDRTNYLSTLMHMLNGFIGSGILSMPITFKNGGLILASVMNPMIGILSCHCIHMLIQINELSIKIDGRTTPLDYHELAEFAFRIGPKLLRPWARIARYFVLVAIACTQIGGCCVYYLFIGTNVQKFLSQIYGTEKSPSKEACLAMILPIVIGINYIRNIRRLTFLSTISNFLQVAGIGIILYNLSTQPWPEFPDQLPKIGEKIPQFFVSSLFIFEGISLSMSLYKTIDKAEKFSRPFGVLNVGLLLIGAFYFTLGFMGYSCYGSNVEATITANLTGSHINNTVQVLYALAVLFTYPIILYVPIQILWPIMERNLRNKFIVGDGILANRTTLIIELSFRTGLVLFTYMLASVVHKLELIISLIGAITSSSIAVIIPSTLHLITFYGQCSSGHQRRWLLTKNLAIMMVGWSGFFLGSYYSLCDIIGSYRSDDDLIIVAQSTIAPLEPFRSSIE